MAIFNQPAGIVPDKSAGFGLSGLINNVNNYSVNATAPINAGGGVTLTAAQVGSGLVLITAASGPFNITLPSTTAIFGILGATIATDGSYAEPLEIQNENSGQTGTLVAGDGNTTLPGVISTIATNTCRTFLLVVTSASTITIRNTGTKAL